MARTPKADELIACGVHPSSGRDLLKPASGRACRNCVYAGVQLTLPDSKGPDFEVQCLLTTSKTEPKFPACVSHEPRQEDDKAHGLWRWDA